ncbi:hypothetical protein, partial [Methylobacterium isbiliense]|uniref:hypothetical protein n=1 Tax=Methylobacterium isbiliense TaxID=315478 RepID=UPI001EDE9FDC
YNGDQRAKVRRTLVAVVYNVRCVSVARDAANKNTCCSTLKQFCLCSFWRHLAGAKYNAVLPDDAFGVTPLPRAVCPKLERSAYSMCMPAPPGRLPARRANRKRDGPDFAPGRPALAQAVLMERRPWEAREC